MDHQYRAQSHSDNCIGDTVCPHKALARHDRFKAAAFFWVSFVTVNRAHCAVDLAGETPRVFWRTAVVILIQVLLFTSKPFLCPRQIQCQRPYELNFQVVFGVSSSCWSSFTGNHAQTYSVQVHELALARKCMTNTIETTITRIFRSHSGHKRLRTLLLYC